MSIGETAANGVNHTPSGTESGEENISEVLVNANSSDTREGFIKEYYGQKFAVFNPHNRPIEELPVIYGFNNGGAREWYSAQLLAEDGTGLGGHVCSHEGFMYGDLGILEGSRPDRHETFRAHYPCGYRMDFVPKSEVRKHDGLALAYQRNQERAKAEGVTT